MESIDRNAIATFGPLRLQLLQASELAVRKSLLPLRKNIGFVLMSIIIPFSRLGPSS
ncbi:hypothetical protein C8R31_102539 [Nitrosospira sp. Nsp2]|uniref:hypothetical protein n=1 Tax=Nitrosospira sp. Nsp2 TaxID=136548 RepID=UPI000D4C901C|nr:hypothetical protein [Nitrosospira sp. Nsp2]PTR16522.1 hypothetical protein C8R31_102539 [Nitrosospira sp. Nsp2]